MLRRLKIKKNNKFRRIVNIHKKKIKKKYKNLYKKIKKKIILQKSIYKKKYKNYTLSKISIKSKIKTKKYNINIYRKNLEILKINKYSQYNILRYFINNKKMIKYYNFTIINRNKKFKKINKFFLNYKHLVNILKKHTVFFKFKLNSTEKNILSLVILSTIKIFKNIVF